MIGQAETVYVIASRDGAETIVPEQNAALENILKVRGFHCIASIILIFITLQKQNNLELVVDSNGDQNYILSTEVSRSEDRDPDLRFQC